VIYTSGSTGRPKGVQIPHRAVVNFLSSMAERPGLSTGDRLLAVTSLSFDIAGLEIWLPLTVGAQVEIASRETTGDGAKLRRLLETGGITVMQATPSTFRLLIEAGWAGTPGLKVLIGGEATPPELAEKLLDRAASVWNMYGPTETTIWSCIQPLQKSAPVLIGRPIDNTRTYVLDQRGNPVPAGVTGELYIGGDGLAHGYLGRPDLTSQRFVPDPFHGGGSRRLYRTGDLCRQRRDGAIEFLGRADFQVKLRGYRIELGEIEATLAEHPAIREAVVVAFEGTPGDQKLVAYVTTREAAPSAADLRSHLRAKLPEYMVPARFIVLEKLPLTANNKIDRHSLPPPNQVAASPAAAEPDDRLPRSALETKLRGVWEEVLGVQGIGVHDNFFEIGGHSLLALKLFDRVSRTFGVNLPIASLFQAPTIAGLGRLLRQEDKGPSWSSLVPIQTAGTRRPLFCVHAIGGNVLNYRLLSKHLGDQQPLYGIQARGLGGDEAPHATVEEMAAGYIQEMRQQQPYGPYQICGSSSGGVIAFEMAQQLHAAGERVSALVMLDTYRVGPSPDPITRALAASPFHPLGMRLDVHFGHLLLRTPHEGLKYLAGRLRLRVSGMAGPLAAALKAATPAVRHVIHSHLRAFRAYVPRPYPGSAVMLLSRDVPSRTSYDWRLAWADLLEEGLILRFIPGTHENMLDEPQVAGVAATLAPCLSR
jgi:thioesterase domain-containing protein